MQIRTGSRIAANVGTASLRQSRERSEKHRRSRKMSSCREEIDMPDAKPVKWTVRLNTGETVDVEAEGFKRNDCGGTVTFYRDAAGETVKAVFVISQITGFWVVD
jgi:hypothetical protein